MAIEPSREAISHPRAPARISSAWPRGRPRLPRLASPAAGCVNGGITATVHHVRFCGSPKDDRRTLPMEAGYHQEQEGPESIEKLGKTKWQALHGVDIEAQISKYQRNYLETHPNVIW